MDIDHTLLYSRDYKIQTKTLLNQFDTNRSIYKNKNVKKDVLWTKNYEEIPMDSYTVGPIADTLIESDRLWSRNYKVLKTADVNKNANLLAKYQKLMLMMKSLLLRWHKYSKNCEELESEFVKHLPNHKISQYILAKKNNVAAVPPAPSTEILDKPNISKPVQLDQAPNGPLKSAIHMPQINISKKTNIPQEETNNIMQSNIMPQFPVSNINPPTMMQQFPVLNPPNTTQTFMAPVPPPAETSGPPTIKGNRDGTIKEDNVTITYKSPEESPSPQEWKPKLEKHITKFHRGSRTTKLRALTSEKPDEKKKKNKKKAKKKKMYYVVTSDSD